MKLRIAGAVAVLSLVALAGIDRPLAQSDLPMAKPETVGVSSKRLERVKAYIQEYIDTNQIADRARALFGCSRVTRQSSVLAGSAWSGA